MELSAKWFLQVFFDKLLSFMIILDNWELFIDKVISIPDTLLSVWPILGELRSILILIAPMTLLLLVPMRLILVLFNLMYILTKLPPAAEAIAARFIEFIHVGNYKNRDICWFDLCGFAYRND